MNLSFKSQRPNPKQIPNLKIPKDWAQGIDPAFIEKLHFFLGELCVSVVKKNEGG